MSNITNTDAVVTESKLTEFYEDIKPFLGCPAYLTSEGTSDYYSTDEKVIGRWTNGKPLYQKVISGNLPSSAGSTGYPHSISDVDEFICVKGIVFWGGHESTEMPVINANSKATVIFIPSINDSTVLINVDSDRSSTTFAVIIQYTKTTDSASTTIQEDPNEYSTDEKIIGKWIDGKPIYQRTWTGLDVSTAYNSWTNIVRIPNISLIIDVKAYGLDSTNHSLLPAALEFAVQSTDYIATEANTSINLRVIKMITVQYTKTTD